MRTISIINQKGGCGKTTTAINLAGIFARRGARVLLVDMDPQSHCAAGLAIPEQRIDLDIGDAMLAEPGRPVEKSRLLWRASRNLDLAPSRMKLAGLEAARGGLADKDESERRLSLVLERLAPSYDVCFIDCSPSIGLLTFNALAAASHILIPVETSFFALQGATKQVNTIRSMAKRLGASAEHWLIATLHDETSVLSRDLLEELRRRFGNRVAPVAVRRDVALKEAASFGQPVIEYAPSSPGANDYSALADWLAQRVGLALNAGPAGVMPPAVRVVETKWAPVVPGSGAGAVSGESGASGETGRETAAAGADAAAPDAGGGAGRGADEGKPTGSPTAGGEGGGDGESVEMLAERARALLLKRADEQLRRIVSGEKPAPLAGVPSVASQVAVAEADRSVVEPLRVTIAGGAGAARAEQVRGFFGARNTRSGVLFVQPLTIGTWVAIAGDFNEWTPSKSVMRRNEELGVFELCVPLAPGRRRYRLVVDGRWITDPSNPRSEPNEYGEFNSIIDVPSAAATTPATPATI